MSDMIDRAAALAAIDAALNNATGDLFDAHAAIAALPPAQPAASDAQADGPATIYLTEVDYEDPDFPLVWASASADSGGVPYHREHAVEALVKAAEAFKDFDDMPTAHKRPDVFELKVRKPLLAALAAIRKGATP